MIFEPMLATSSRTFSSSPRPIEDTPITTATPITMPSTVNDDRSLLPRIVSVAICTISLNSLFRNMDQIIESLSDGVIRVFHTFNDSVPQIATFQTAAPQSDPAGLPSAPDTLRKILPRSPPPASPRLQPTT